MNWRRNIHNTFSNIGFSCRCIFSLKACFWVIIFSLYSIGCQYIRGKWCYFQPFFCTSDSRLVICFGLNMGCCSFGLNFYRKSFGNFTVDYSHFSYFRWSYDIDQIHRSFHCRILRFKRIRSFTHEDSGEAIPDLGLHHSFRGLTASRENFHFMTWIRKLYLIIERVY